jgi:hypothetical protein
MPTVTLVSDAAGGPPPVVDAPLVVNRSAAVRAQRARYVSASIGHATSVVVDRARGAEIWDVDGRCITDHELSNGLCTQRCFDV